MGFHTLFFFNGSMIFPQVFSRLLVVFLLFIWEHQYHPTCYLWRPRLVVGGNRWLVSLEFQRLKLNKVIQEKSQETMGNTFRNECDTNLLLLRPEDRKYTHQPFKRLVDTIFCIGSFIYIYIYHITLLSWISPSAMTRTAWQLAALAWTMQSSHATSAVLLLHLWQRKRKRHQSQLALFLVGWMGWLSFVSWQIADSILISPQIDPQSFLFVLAKCLNHWSLGEEIQNILVMILQIHQPCWMIQWWWQSSIGKWWSFFGGLPKPWWVHSGFQRHLFICRILGDLFLKSLHGIQASSVKWQDPK